MLYGASTMAHWYVGTTGLQGKLERYAQRYDLLEVRPVDSPLPRAAKLESWRSKVPPAFAFSVVLPDAVARLEPGPAHDEALGEALEAARQLQARSVVLSTPPSVRPTRANRQRIAALTERLPRGGHLLAWQARGMWEAEDVLETAYQAGWLPVFDAAQEALPPGPVAYTRIRAIGQASRLGADRIARVAEQLAGRREAFVVVDAHAARAVKAGLEAAIPTLEDRRPVPTLFRPDALEIDDEEQ
jgi:uncharacterized protein YecE (DUF72 family)